ncbi:MAG: hypothetical protein RLT05_22310 [Bauldia litoralis]
MTIKQSRVLKIAAGVVMAAAILAGGTAARAATVSLADIAQIEAQMGTIDQVAQRACPRIYRPVCGVVHGQRRTYSNNCVARNAGARIVSRGQCRARACTRIYRPVCGVVHGQRRTYSNSCVARNAGARIVAQGQCRTRACPRIYRPVCGVVHGQRRTYSNSCVARNAGARIVRPGRCPQ